jgi:Ca2+-binding RTX toxin-like protein
LLAGDVIGVAGDVTIAGNTIRVDGVTIATFVTGTDFVVSFTSNATVNRVQTLVRNLTFRNTSDDPAVSHVLAIDLAGVIRADTVTVTPVNDRPVVDLNGSGPGRAAAATFVEQAPVAIAPAATLSDVDSANLNSLTAVLTSRPDGGAVEQLSLNAAAAAAAVGLAVSYNQATGTLSITGSASKVTYQTILQGIIYSNTSDNPNTSNRTVRVVVSDGQDNSIARDVDIRVIRVNDAPIVDLNGGASGNSVALDYAPGTSLTKIAPAGLVTDVDSNNFNGGSLRVSFSQNGSTGDVFGIMTDAIVTLTGGGSTVRINGVAIGTVSGGTGGADLVITFTSGNATAARVQSLLQHIGYSNSSGSPSTLTRTVTFALNDGDGTENGGQNIGVATATIVFPTGNNDNQAPTAVAFANTTTSINENTNTTAGVKVADIVVTDDALGTETLTLVGDDATFFEIVGTELRLKAGVLNFEGKSTYSVQVAADDGAAVNTDPLNPDALSGVFTVTVSDQNEAPTAVAFANVTTTIDENTNTTAGVKVADIVVTDDALGTETLTPVGDDAAFFEIVGTELRLKAGVLNFEAKSSYSVRVAADDGTAVNTDPLNPDALSGVFTVTVSDQNEAPAITSDGGGATALKSVVENTTAVTTVTADDPDLADNPTFSIDGGLDAARFTINPNTGALSFLNAPNFENPQDVGLNNHYEVVVKVSDGEFSDTQTITVAVTNAADAPVITSGSGLTASYAVNENVALAATIAASDEDETSTVVFSIDGGADAGLFAINQNTGALSFLNAPNFEAGGDNVYQVTVKASDGALHDSQSVTITINDVNEAPTAIALSSALVDELSAIGTVVGTLSATDADAADQDAGDFTYKLVDDADGRFIIVGDELRVNGDIDFETIDSGVLTIQMQVTDSAGNIFGQSLDIAINDLVEAEASDGYIAGATVFADANGNFIHNAGEASATTDAFGNLNFSSSGHPIVLTGGTDIATGLSFEGLMAAASGATVISPLTTIVVAHMNQFATNEAAANTAVLTGLGIDPAVGLLSQYDQIEAVLDGDPNGSRAAKAATELHNSMMLAVAVLVAAGASEAAASAASAAFAREVANWIGQPGSAITTTDQTRIAQLINDAATALGVTPNAAVVSGTADIIAAFNAAVDGFASTGVGLLEYLAQSGIVAHAAQANLAGANSTTIGGLVALYTGMNLSGAIAAADPQDVQGINGDNTITGTAGADFLFGGDGNDTLNGLDGDDVLDGGEGNDTINAGYGRDILIGGPGNEILDGGFLYDGISNAGNGDVDRVSYQFAPSAVTVDLSIQDGVTDQGTGGGGIDTLKNIEGVIGSAHNDFLYGGGSDFLETFRGGAGDDFINGRGGNDRAEYLDATAGVTIQLAAGIVNGVAGGVGTDTLRSVESIRGSEFADTFNAVGFSSLSTNAGSNGTSNSFRPGDGDDVLLGNDDTQLDYFNAPHGLTVDLTNRDVDANTGRVYGGVGIGTDTFSDIRRVRGSMFDDTLIGGQQENSAGSNAEFFDGVGGNDFIDGGSGFDYAQYRVAAQVLQGVTITDDPTTTTINESTRTFGIVVNLAAGTVIGDATSFGTDTLREVEGIVGSVLDDLYDARGFGSNSVNHLSLGLVVDEFEGGAGDDIIIGSGNTRVSYRNADEGVTVTLNPDGSGTVTGGASIGSDILVSGISSIRGSDFSDTLTGYNNPAGTTEFFDGQGGDDIIDGNGGFDRVTYDQDNDVTQGITITLTATGNANAGGTLNGLVTGNAAEVGNDQLFDIESVRGTEFADILTITALGVVNNQSNFGLLELEGSAGNDVLNGLFIGGTVTRIAFNAATAGVAVTFNNSGTGTTNSGSASGDVSVGTDTFNNIRDVRSGIYDDVITGRTSGTAGNIDNSQLQGGAGGNDRIEGGLGNDTIWGGDNNIANGTELFDGITASGFEDIDRASYASANGSVTVNLGAGTANQGTATNIGSDILNNIEGVIGSAGGDTLTGGSAAFVEFFRGGGGDDAINGGSGIDAAEYVDATVTGVIVNLTAGTVTGGGLGVDTLTSVEFIIGSAFDDTFDATGFSGTSTNAGSSGAFNIFRPGDGNDTIIGNGNTRLDYSNASSGLTIDLTLGGLLDPWGDTDIFSGVNQVRGTDFADILIGGQAAYNAAGTFEGFIGGGGNDQIVGGAGFDRASYQLDGNIETGITVDLATGTVSGDAALTGVDTLTSIESITGSVLADTYNALGFGAGSVNVGSNGTLNEFEGHAGNDTIIGNGNTRIAFYNAQAGVTVDLAVGTASGNASVGTDSVTGVNRVRGSDFDDSLFGNDVVNILEGQAGNDRIEGRGGNDTLTGDAGDDTFVFNANFGKDVITDFTAASGDVIAFGNAIFANFAAVQAAMTQAGTDVLITSGVDTVTIKNMTIASLTLSEFDFV